MPDKTSDLIRTIKEKSLAELASLTKQSGLSCSFFSSLFRTLMLAKNENYLPLEMKADLELILAGQAERIKNRVLAKLKTSTDHLGIVSYYLISKGYKLSLINPLADEDLGEEPEYDQKCARIGYLTNKEYLGLVSAASTGPFSQHFRKVFVENKPDFIKANIEKNPIIGFKPESGEYRAFPPILSHCLCLLSLDNGQLTYFDPWSGEIRERDKDYFYSRLTSDLLLIEKPKEVQPA